MTIPRQWTADEDAFVIARRTEGYTYNAIGRAMGIHHSMVLRRANVIGARLVVKAVPPPIPQRDPCGHCGVRLDAPADMGCNTCRAYRSIAA